MTIKSLGPKGPEPRDPRKSDAAAKGQRVTPTSVQAPRVSGANPEIGDQIKISAEAVELAARQDIPRGALPAARLTEISQRVASGFYNQTYVLDATARGVLADLVRPESA